MTNQEFKENYKCPRLQGKNLNAAYIICRILKEEKCLSNEAMIDELIKARSGHWMDRLPQNFTNIHAFLRYHDMCTQTTVNGLVIHVATQKCFRSKEKNWFLDK